MSSAIISADAITGLEAAVSDTMGLLVKAIRSAYRENWIFITEIARTMKMKLRSAILLAGVALCSTISRTDAQVATQPDKRSEIEKEFQRELMKAEQAKIVRLGELAGTQSRDEALSTYNDLFRFAIGASLYDAAEPFAEKVIAGEITSPETLLLAQMVNVVAEANRGAFDESLASLAKAVHMQPEGTPGEQKKQFRQALPLPARMSLINAYIQRLIHARRYDVAQKALTMIAGVAKDQQIKSLVTKRLLQVSLVGKSAPPIVGTDLEGKPINLLDHKGDLVLVVFWASWCAPNLREANQFEQIGRKYRDKGLRIIGINLDTLQDSGVTTAAVMPAVRRFLIENNISWPNLINTEGEHDYAKAYGVTELPTDILVGRDGTILHLDLDAATLEKLLPTLLAK